MLCAVIPDADVIGFHYGVHYADFWGHRGFTHSLVFAGLLAAAATALLIWSGSLGLQQYKLFAYLLMATASHGVLDAMTDGGLGVAFFAPLNDRRYFLPWRPIHVSPISISRFFSERGLTIFQTELLWIWLPSAFLVALTTILRRRRQIQATT
jgi:inner membrane protein